MINGARSEDNSKKQYLQIDIEQVDSGDWSSGVRKEKPHRRVLKSSIQDEILLLLTNESLHGYGVWNAILRNHPDMRLNTLYRWMNDLERRGLVEGNLRPGVKGPNRKVYVLTTAGRQRFLLLIRNAFKLIIDIHRRYQLFSALHFSNLPQLSEVSFSNSRALIAPFDQFLDYDYALLQILICAMKGRRVDLIGDPQDLSNIHPRPRILKGNIQNLELRKDSYGEIWLVGIPKRSSFSASIEACKELLTKGGTLYLVIPFLISSSDRAPVFGPFISNAMIHVFPELELLEFNEVKSILTQYFKETGMLQLSIPVFWAKK